MNNYKGILPKGFVLDGKFKVLLFIKQGRNAETYRLKGNDGNLYFLKLFNLSKISRTSFDENNNLLEIEFLKRINHENIVSYKYSGELIYENKKFVYLILNFIAGETLAERIIREPFSNYFDVKQIVINVLKGLNYLHSLKEPIIHNEITPNNIMLDLTTNVSKAVIIDFGYARAFHQSTKTYNRDGLNLSYIAPECFNNIYSPQSDLYSVGVVMYQMIFGMIPWYKNTSKFQASRNIEEELILQERAKSLIFPNVSDKIIGFEESINLILKKALSNDIEKRFQTASEFIDALNGKIEVEDISSNPKSYPSDKFDWKKQGKKLKDRGFDAIAGMKELKDQLKLDVIDALHNPDEYSKYGLTIPNGMLLYGPPGCGKTFFAKCFAEEIGCEFMLLTPASLKSKYVNATQENIAKLFEDAEKKAPIIIFIDEINELLPNRQENDVHEMSKAAVNEFLAQMDRTSDKGIFIIGATNFPTSIDPAALRSGRLEKKFYIPPPDFEARRAMFELYLKTRPLDFGIDYDRLAKLTENYVSSDIEFIVSEASRKALQEKARISMKIIENIIKNTKPSVPLQELKKYEQIRKIMEGETTEIKRDKPTIGFVK